ncbi:MAG: hypothetical protein ABSH04_08315 [Acidimicrobiales bacterium]
MTARSGSAFNLPGIQEVQHDGTVGVGLQPDVCADDPALAQLFPSVDHHAPVLGDHHVESCVTAFDHVVPVQVDRVGHVHGVCVGVDGVEDGFGVGVCVGVDGVEDGFGVTGQQDAESGVGHVLAVGLRAHHVRARRVGGRGVDACAIAVDRIVQDLVYRRFLAHRAVSRVYVDALHC